MIFNYKTNITILVIFGLFSTSSTFGQDVSDSKIHFKFQFRTVDELPDLSGLSYINNYYGGIPGTRKNGSFSVGVITTKEFKPQRLIRLRIGYTKVLLVKQGRTDWNDQGDYMLHYKKLQNQSIHIAPGLQFNHKLNSRMSVFGGP